MSGGSQTVEGKGGSNGGVSSSGVSSIVRELTGDLKCASCGYNLRGVSIRGVCPECGLAVRATILAVVDPRAGELKPVVMPRLTGTALLVCPVLVLVSVLCVWAIRVGGVLTGSGLARVDLSALKPVSVWTMAGAAAVSVALVSPVSGRGWEARGRAFAGVVAFLGLAWVHALVVTGIDAPAFAAGAVSAQAFDGDQSLWRLLVAVLATGVILGLRPNAVRLAYRSVVLRTGRVDRQPLLALAAALGVAAAGDVVLLVGAALGGTARDVTGWVGLMLIVVGSFLFTLGLWGIVVDTWRVRKVIVRPSVGLEDIMSEGAS